MKEHKTFFGKLLASIFGGLFNAAKHAYESLSAEAKTAMLHGSGVIDLINSMLDKTPTEIRAAIQAKFPDLKEADLEAGLFALANTFNFTGATNIDELIAALQKYLSSNKGKAWETISHALSVGLSALFSPETRIAAITNLIEYVYQHLIKKQ